MRIKEKITDIDYGETRQFFKNRADKFQEDNPYSVTMYQDNNKDGQMRYRMKLPSIAGWILAVN